LKKPVFSSCSLRSHLEQTKVDRAVSKFILFAVSPSPNNHLSSSYLSVVATMNIGHLTV